MSNDIIDQSASSTQSTPSEVSYQIVFDMTRCVSCGLCEAFCPVDVIKMSEPDSHSEHCRGDHWSPCGTPDSQAADGHSGDSRITNNTLQQPLAVAPELCWGCETCAGQCPQNAIKVTATAGYDPFQDRELAPPLPSADVEKYRSWANTLKDILGLRWEPVAISLIPAGDPLPDVPIPEERLRYCQSLMAARRGRSIMMPANRHACPDGTSILGLTSMPAKLASGELYILFHKLDNIAAAQNMVHERPSLEPRTIDATVVTPLSNAATTPQVVAVIAQPEQVMWLLMSSSYYSGHRHDLHASGYNAQCVETTLLPYTTGELNISFGCYGCRASSDVGDDLMFVGIPVAMMDEVISGLQELGKKAIKQSRSKIYLPPMV
jgi:uncharacterized protein (DUF169 family)/NAD-dependent dihydropyrimidine dehydrogenase PreA subunit